MLTRGTATASERPETKRPSAAVLKMWREADAVAFDVDSTVCVDEGIDELGAFLGARERVEAITKKAMEGGMDFSEALQLRLEAMAVTSDSLKAFVSQHPPRYSNGIKVLVDSLRANGKEVFLVSGGFRQMVHPVGAGLSVPTANIHANTITFNADGSLKGFDRNEFPSKSGGKATAVKHIKATRGYKTMVMIGDGATDLEARVAGGADIFIGYGGAQRRPKVEAEADWFVTDLLVLAEALSQEA